MRLFVAIELPGAVRAAIGRLRDELAALDPAGRVRWVRDDRLHCTVKFLGELEPARLEPLAAALREASARAVGCTVRSGPVGALPSLARPRVIYTALEPREPLARIAEAIDRAAARCGIERERRPFVPHVTLGRLREGRRRRARAGSGLPAALEQRVAAAPVPRHAPFAVTELALIESELR
ncbi:MAG: RNA 2',3'-cyclic phosphodiesterase, partial [Planctomycetota bacterium]